MPVYYQGPMPKTDEERATMRVEAFAELRRMKGEWEETTNRRGSDVLAPVSAREQFKEWVHKLLIATGEVDPNLFETSQPFLKNKAEGRPYDGIPVSFLLGSLDRVLRKFDDER
jgi:hypothetical protein